MTKYFVNIQRNYQEYRLIALSNITWYIIDIILVRISHIIGIICLKSFYF